MLLLSGAGEHTAAQSSHWVEHLHVDDLSCGTYSPPAGGTDDQEPHTEDEIYVCTAGAATLWTPDGSAPIRPGSVAFVPAGEEHRFVDITEDLTLLVIFGPAEYTRATS
jgi:mannose-6-phosphate isomerase-like protein (cupin superfamily)